MSRHYALLSVTGISEEKFQDYLFAFINKMDKENEASFGASVLGMDERTGKNIVAELEN